MDNLNKIVYYAQAFANDLKYIYLHCMGKDFDTIRTLSNELWIELNAEIDEMSEILILNGIEVDNPSEIKSQLDFDTEWPATNNQIIGSKYLLELENAALPKDIKYLYINFWRNKVLFRSQRYAVPENNFDRLGEDD